MPFKFGAKAPPAIKDMFKTKATNSKECTFQEYVTERPDADSKEGPLLKMWKITKDYTAKMAKSAIEKIIKLPFDLYFKIRRRYKTRPKGDEKTKRWWIEISKNAGSEEGVEILKGRKEEIENCLDCRLEYP